MIYDSIYRNIVFPLYDRYLRRRSTYDYYKELEGNSRMPVEDWKRMRSSKLNSLIRYSCENVPFYRELFDQKSVNPDKIGHIESLRQCGITTSKKILRESSLSPFSGRYRRGELINTSTSGSTGEPFLVHMTFDDWCRRMAVKYRSEGWFGKPIGTPTAMIWGHKPGLSGWARIKEQLYWRFQNYQFFSAFDVDDRILLGYIERIRKGGSRFIESYVTIAYQMATLIQKYQIDPPRLDGIVIGAERLFDFQRGKIEESFSCPVYNRYGSTEFSNVASECLQQEGLHINVDSLWVEVVDEQDRPVLEEPGDIIITDLHNYAMPLIRYRTGDIGTMGTERCSCGRTFPMLRDIKGRASEVLRTEDGRTIHDMYFLWKLSRVPGIDRFQVIQDSLNHLDVNIVHDGSVSRELTSRNVEQALSGLDDHNIAVTVRYVDSIAVSRAGKTSFFRSEIEQGEDELDR